MILDLKGFISLIKGMSTYLPGITRFIQKKSGATVGTSSARYCYSVWLRHLVIAYKNGFVEHPKVVADRLIQFSKVVSKEQLMAGTDCGFSTFAGFGKIDEEICFYKLKALVEGAAIASKII